MTVFNEGRHAAEFLMSEAEGHRSRDNVTIVESQTITPGTLLGKVGDKAGATAGVVGAMVGTGNGALTMANPSTGAGAKAGVYQATCIEAAANGGTFLVEDPDGIEVGVAEVGVAFVGIVKFTIADGATDFVAGDKFPITVTLTPAATAGKFKGWDPAANDGSEAPAAIALYPATTGAGQTAAIAAVTRDCEVNTNILEWGTATSDQKAAAIAALAALGIIVR